MEATIEKRVNELAKRVKSFRNGNPTEQELRQFYIDYIGIHRALDDLDTNLRKICDGYCEVNNAWYDRYPVKINPVNDSIHLGDLFGRLL